MKFPLVSAFPAPSIRPLAQSLPSPARTAALELQPMPKTLATPVHCDIVIKKSRFLGCVQPVSDRAQAQAIVAGLRQQHPAASHVCWALLAGGQSAAVDDGEPSGTAGRPMFEVLRHQDLEGVMATVVRYFGGVKLGAGGLVRAYTDCIAQALMSATKIEIVLTKDLHCVAPYALEGLVRREIERSGAGPLTVTHAENVDFRFSLPADSAQSLILRLNEAGSGKIDWKP